MRVRLSPRVPNKGYIMTHFVVMVGDEYMTHRKATNEMYVSRTSWSDNISDARVFTKPGPAMNSARSAVDIESYSSINVLPVELKIVDPK